MNPKKIILILIVVIALLGLAMIFVVGIKKTRAPEQQGETQKITAGNAKLVQSSEGKVTYKSDATGFTVEIPGNWKDKYKAIETPNSATGGFSSEGGYISFQLPTTDTDWAKRNSSNNFEFLSIVAYPVSKLPAFQKECQATGNESPTCVVIKNKIGQNDAYAFSYIKSNKMADYPKDFTLDDLSLADSVSSSFRTGEVEKVSTENWKLISGNPLDNCSRPTYQGEAIIRGWYEWDYIYVEKDWVLKIAAEDQDKLPIYYYDEKGKAHYSDGAILKGGSPELIAKLKKASKSNPATLTIKRFSAYCEGLPSVSL